MSNSNNIKLLLDIQDKNIEIGENAVELRSYQGRMAKFITAKFDVNTKYRWPIVILSLHEDKH